MIESGRGMAPQDKPPAPRVSARRPLSVSATPFARGAGVTVLVFRLGTIRATASTNAAHLGVIRVDRGEDGAEISPAGVQASRPAIVNPHLGHWLGHVNDRWYPST
jgi:hypothetical protein